eukprot:gene11359-12543_t
MVRKIKIESDAAFLCFLHAFSTEKEEVMGLLIGEITDEDIAHVHAVIMLRRSDKRKDRVEISPEQLSNASCQAEISFYVSTQSMYQMMDKDFVGVIISCFSEDSSSLVGDIQMTCFQAINIGTSDFPKLERLEIEVEVIPSFTLSEASLSTFVDLPCILEEEESEAYNITLLNTMQDLVTALHNGTVYTKAVCQLVDVICAPLLQAFEQLLKTKNYELQSLKIEKERLEKALAT